VANAVAGDPFNELGKLLTAIKADAARTAFKNNGTLPPGVTAGVIPAPVVANLRGMSDACLKVVADMNTLHLANGLACGANAGIAAV
jgi:lipid-binding SYLF domain-containing protein